MDIKDYEIMVSELRKDPHVILAELTAQKCDMMHAAIGLTGEAGEICLAVVAMVTRSAPLDIVNIVEELGDMEFYANQLMLVTGLAAHQCLPVTVIQPTTVIESAMRISASAGRVADTVKRHVIYNRPLCVGDVQEGITCLLTDMGRLARAVNVTLDECKLANMAKLAKRYPNYSYTDARAHERLDKSGS
jgi:hypothetical protein